MGIDTVNDLPPRVQYVAAASQTVFPYPFPIFTNADLVVVVDGVTQALDTNYTVSGATSETGGNVTFLVGRTAGQVVTIYRDIPIERDTDFQQNGPYTSERINDELDKAFLLLQQLESSVGRTLRLPVTAAATDAQTELSPLSNWLGKYVTIGATGLPEPGALVSGSVTPSLVGQLLFPQTADEVAASVVPANYTYPVGHVHRYGAVGDGTTNDAVAISTAFSVVKQAQGGVVTFEPRTYFLGSFASATNAISVTGLGNVAVDGAGAELLVNTTAAVVPTVLNLVDANNVLIRNLRFRDSGADISVEFRGARAVSLTASGAADCGNVCLLNVAAESLVALLDTYFTASTGRVRNIAAINCTATSCYYGANLREQGDSATFANFYTRNVRRALFAYGTTGLSADLSISHDGTAPGSNGCVLIKRIERDTRNVAIRAVYHGSLAQYGGLVVLEAQPTSGSGIVDGVSVDLNLAGATYNVNAIPVRIRSFTAGGSLETTTANRFDRVSLKGNFGAWAADNASNPILIESTQNTRGRLALSADLFSAFSAQRQHFPGFSVHVGPQAFMLTKTGNLTSGVLNIDLSQYNGRMFGLRVRTYAEADFDTASTSQTYREHIVFGFNASGVTISSTTAIQNVVAGTGSTVTFTANAQGIDITFSAYTSAGAYARVVVEHLGKVL